jgi:putative PIN family toxin of toxin-antitoxin system
MNGSTRYVFDTNVLISALLFEHSRPGRAFRHALQSGQILVSLPMLEELNDVLSRSKFDRYVSAEEREEFLEALIERAAFVEPDEQIAVCRDPKDDKFLELAVSGSARCIISGDDDLLALHPFRGIAIVTVDDFLRQVGSRQPDEEASNG